jgi:hypothetical protein
MYNISHQLVRYLKIAKIVLISLTPVSIKTLDNELLPLLLFGDENT